MTAYLRYKAQENKHLIRNTDKNIWLDKELKAVEKFREARLEKQELVQPKNKFKTYKTLTSTR